MPAEDLDLHPVDPTLNITLVLVRRGRCGFRLRRCTEDFSPVLACSPLEERFLEVRNRRDLPNQGSNVLSIRSRKGYPDALTPDNDLLSRAS